MSCVKKRKGFFWFLLIFFLTTPSSNGNDEDYAEHTVCSYLYSCGSVHNISYPFWGGNRPSFCGRNELQLTCSNSTKDYPTISIGIAGNTLVDVLSINTSLHKMVVALEHFKDGKPPCITQGLDNALNLSRSYRLSTNNVKITLFYGCPSSEISQYQPKSLACTYKNGTKGSALYFSKTSAILRKNTRLCKANYTVPVLKRELDELSRGGNGTLLSVLKKGFEMEYIVNFTACLTCVSSGGRCGSSRSQPLKFACHCRHGPQPVVCHKSEKKNFALRIGLGIAGGMFMLAAMLIGFCYCKIIKLGHSRFHTVALECTELEFGKGSTCCSVPLFAYNELEKATDNFNQSGELGTGGFGIVYYGKLRDGREVAVKRLFSNSYRRVEHFMNEVQILNGLKHQNLVSLYGCTSLQSRELLLVYEYVPNGTLADHLYGKKAKSGLLPWLIRLRIALETASALSYLHASDVIHRDVKTNNILLDSNFSVKVADFGLSRLFPTDVTHVSTAPQGSPGYLDPEYNQCYQLTDKSDVYSFGVVLLGLVSSFPAVDMNRNRQEINLSNYAMNKIQRCALDELVDSKLGFMSDFKVRRMTTAVAELAVQCLQHNKDFRPSMDDVLEALKRIESADYEALKAEEETENGGMKRIEPPSSTAEDDDDAQVLASHQPHPSSPNSEMVKWGSSSTRASTSN